MAVDSILPGNPKFSSIPELSSIRMIIVGIGVGVLTYHLYINLLSRNSVPVGAPPLWQRDDWPIVGALRFFTARADMVRDVMSARSSTDMQTDNFSFFIGKKHVVGIGKSIQARLLFFNDKEMSLMQGTAELLTGLPLTKGQVDKFGAFFLKSMATMLQRENFVRNLHLLTSDAREMSENLKLGQVAHYQDDDVALEGDYQWRVMDPFEVLYRLVYQMTIRTVGADEIAEDRSLGDYTLSVFQSLEHRESIAKVYLPWIPAPGHYLRIWDGYRLHRVISRIVKQRNQTGTRRQDALQLLIDSNASAKDITGFIVNSLFGGQVNTGINAAWIPIFLSQCPEWKSKVVTEVTSVISRHRKSDTQTVADILGSLPLDVWEREFPCINLSLRESIRLTIVGAPMRKNTTGKEVKLGDDVAGSIPNGSYGTFLVDLVHFNPDIYKDPYCFDPSRYEAPRLEDQKEPFAFVGWGAGRHPCLGMRFAKLEITIITAYFVAMFDFELAATEQGQPTIRNPPPVDRNGHFATKPESPIFLRYRPRI